MAFCAFILTFVMKILTNCRELYLLLTETQEDSIVLTYVHKCVQMILRAMLHSSIAHSYHLYTAVSQKNAL
jgi:hypothetical protein